MATVTLDPLGRLIRFDRALTQKEGATASTPGPDWDRLFGEAGLNVSEFVPAEPHDTPLAAHDSRLAWERRSALSGPLHVTAATRDGKAVHFDVAGDGVTTDTPRNAFSTGRSPASEALFLRSSRI
jgi:hypothetical protein